MIRNVPGIYIIKCLINNKLYLGSTVTLGKRKDKHFNSLKSNKHHSIHLQRAYNKFGVTNFKFEILEYVEKLPEESLMELRHRLINKEQCYLDSLLLASESNSKFHELGYNICRKANSCLGVKRSDETKQKQRKPKSLQARINIGLARKGKPSPKRGKPSTRVGYSPSIETRKKISEAQKGRKVPLERIQKQLETKKKNGTLSNWTPERRKKDTETRRSTAYLEKVRISHSLERRLKNSLGQRGKLLSEETKRKISQSLKGKPKSEEHKNKLRIKKEKFDKELMEKIIAYKNK